MRALRSVLILALTCLSVGCFGHTPEVRKYFHRQDALTALLGFAYAVEVGEWEYAFECLNEESRKAVETPGRLRFAVWLEKEPSTGRNIGELITESIRHRADVRIESHRVSSIDVAYSANREKFEPEIILTVFLVREGDDWFVDLMTSIQNLPQELAEE